MIINWWRCAVRAEMSIAALPLALRRWRRGSGNLFFLPSRRGSGWIFGKFSFVFIEKACNTWYYNFKMIQIKRSFLLNHNIYDYGREKEVLLTLLLIPWRQRLGFFPSRRGSGAVLNFGKRQRRGISFSKPQRRGSGWFPAAMDISV